MRFQVPQFVEIEDKVFGPFTFKQFIYMLGGAGLSFVFYSVLPILLALPFIAVILAISGALAFYKINNKPFVFIVESFFKYQIGNKLYIWKKGKNKAKIKPGENEVSSPMYVPKLSGSKLKDIATSLDIETN